MSIPELEQQMGIETYVTTSLGTGGKIRTDVDNFVVEEILVDGSKATAQITKANPALGASTRQYPFLLCVMLKRNWDTFIALKNVSLSLGIDQSGIQIAGIKDAKAQTAQYVTIKGVSASEAASVGLRDIELHPVGYFRNQMSPFYLRGNHFKIDITHITQSKTAVEEQLNRTTAEIATAGGIPNFYGHQRFGTTRTITHLVGRAMVQGTLEEAAMIYLAQPTVYEHPESQRARKRLNENRNFKEALQEFPIQLRFERVMLRHLAEAPKDFKGAFRRLPLKLRILFVQAWQSYLFNRFLSARIKAEFPLSQAEKGDFVVNIERTGLPMPRTGKLVSEENRAEINKLVESGKMRIALPIPGTRQKLSQGEIGELQQEVLDDEGAYMRQFIVSELPEINSKGELRSAVCPVADLSQGKICEESNEKGPRRLSLEFTLLKGAYATVFLREIIKPKDIISAGF